MTELKQSFQRPNSQSAGKADLDRDSFMTEHEPEQTNLNLKGLARLLADCGAKNDLILQEIAEIKKQIRWQKTWGAVRFLLIALPIIFGLIYSLFYLPPEMRESLEYYRSLLRP